MNGASAPISYELVGDADEVVIHIMNEVGDVVRQILKRQGAKATTMCFGMEWTTREILYLMALTQLT